MLSGVLRFVDQEDSAGRRSSRGRRAALWLLSVPALTLTLAACGSSSSNTTATTQTTEAAATTTAAETTQTTTEAAATTPAASIVTPGCRHVPAPPSRAGEQISEPTGSLNPEHSYTVRMETNCGPIVIQLAVKEAPKIANSFAHLVKSGYFNQLTFHRIVPGFVIQGGDPAGNGTGGPSWSVTEAPPPHTRYTKGTVAMAKGGTAPAGASGSQFFIVTGSNVNLPPVYALAGHVTVGERSVESIARVPTEAPPEGGEPSRPRIPVVIEKATLIVH
jgi:peptidyl-prolyl cis-trans isomerase B (cyclophilin B)